MRVTTPMNPTTLIDVHAHFLTPRYVAEAKAAGHARPDGMPGWPSWDEYTHLRQMDQWGVGTSILSISSPGIHFGDHAKARTLARHVNEAGAAIQARHPDRFGHFAAIPLPDVEGSLAEAAHALDELGSDGLILKSNTGGVYLGHHDYAPLYAELDRRHTVVLVHPTSPPHSEAVALGRPRPMLEFVFDSARAASDLLFNGVLENYPNIQWIFPHGGGALPLLGQRMELFRSTFGLAGSTKAVAPEQLGRLWYDMAGTPFPDQIPTLTTALGHDHVLYGSDSCWTPADGVDAQLASIDNAPQPASNLTWRELTSANARRLFPHLP
ncbi:amidohydrolase family protein [Streptomyces sp. NPDC008092]|uniref:amidohydrolase family protein n=1 Tax=Streptomyces sp. NPDC008092 TaxID=3364808 RepID=UPI0036E81710